MSCPEQSETKVSFKDTLNLPQTDFPIRPNFKQDDQALIGRWEHEQLFTQSFEQNQGNEKFILHDGPPYANGHIHIGHAYNKILKDIVTKSQRMMGKHVPVTPGWDCHGLPIEQKVAKEHPNASRAELKKACRDYAQHWIDVQRKEFKDLGVLMDWDHPYITMSHDYEASILKAFGTLVAGGYIERKNKTVPWCMVDQTVLAAAEIEYQERKDPSLFVAFALDEHAIAAVLPNLIGKQVNLLIWTTTPWTLPLNRAVLIKPATTYVVFEHDGNYYIVAAGLVDKVCAAAQIEKKIVAEFLSDELINIGGSHVQHPFIAGLKVPLLADASVLLEEGTALVHCAPGCGPQDYEVGVRNNLEIFSPVDGAGVYTHGIEPQELEGMSVTDGQIWVIKKLAELGKLFFKTTIRHSYPHCWRCRNGLIFRATRQWFCDLEKGELKQKVLTALTTITTIPEKSINRLKATIEGRLEWCLSRQRIWGVPIVALICTRCDYTYITQGLIERVAEKVAQQGIEYWDEVHAGELLPKNFTCPLCANTDFKKELDILDVWFDSGVSHYAVLKQNPQLRFPADMYLEGSDQHRGWFQSSLLTSVALNAQSPMNTIFTHGFVVDEQGRKMSKSIGNVVAPRDIIDQFGTDGLRLWAASLDCSGDAVVSPALLKNVSQVYGKIRNTCRFLLSNLYDFDTSMLVKNDALLLIDQYALIQLYAINKEIQQLYADYDFTAIFHKLGDYCAVELSALYLDMIKDRLYCEKTDGLARRSAQTACWYILDTLTKLMAPVLSFTAEYVSDYYQKDKKGSIHLQPFAQLSTMNMLIESKIASMQNTSKQVISDVNGYTTYHADRLALLQSLRSAVLKEIEQLREKGIVKLPLEVRAAIYIDEKLKTQLQSFFADLMQNKQEVNQFLKEFFIVSQLEIMPSSENLTATAVPGFFVNVEHAQGTKCPRCWQWDTQSNEQGLCARCTGVLG